MTSEATAGWPNGNGSAATDSCAAFDADGDGRLQADELADKVVAIDLARRTVTLRETKGFQGGRPVRYVSTDASFPLAAALEVIAWFLVFGIWLFYRDRNIAWPSKAIDYFFIGFSLSVTLLIGFSINNIGAIARYRSIVTIPLFVPLLAQINWRKFIGSSS